jgi:hypothetical protein
VQAPDIKGVHDDLSDAFARAVYLATEYLSVGGGVAKSNTTTTSAGGGASALSYKRYLMRQRQSSMYTNRPSTSLMMEMGSKRQFGPSSGRR